MADFVDRMVPVVELVERARADERERCAKIVEGEVYKHRYRTWPLLSPGQHDEPSNRSEDSEITKHCHKLAAALRADHG